MEGERAQDPVNIFEVLCGFDFDEGGNLVSFECIKGSEFNACYVVFLQPVLAPKCEDYYPQK